MGDIKRALNSITGLVISSNMSPINRKCTSLYPHCVAHFALYHTVSDIFSIFSEKPPFYIAHLFHLKIRQLPTDLDSWVCGCSVPWCQSN